MGRYRFRAINTLVFDPSARSLSGGRVLLGGQPARLLRLTAAGARLVSRWRAGEPVGPGEGTRALAARLVDAGLAHPRPAPRSARDVAIVIPTRDRPVAAPGEVVVVDDGSRVPLAGARVRFETPRGPAAARNAGLAATTAPFVAFLDSDVLPLPGWLEAVMGHFDDPRVAAVAPRVRVPAGVGALAAYEAVRCPLDLGDAPGRVGPGRRIGYVPAAALVVRRAALAGDVAAGPRGDEPSPVGPFDESLRYGEDVDLVWRLAAAGWIVRYEPAAVVEHPHRATLRAWAAQRFAYGSSAGPLARRHPGRMRHLVLPASLGRVPRLPGVARRECVVLAAEQHARSARQLADAAWRPYAPLLLAHRSGRRVLAAALVAGATADYLQTRPALDPLRFAALRAADDLAYATGVLAGCLRQRAFSPLIPGNLRSTLNSTMI